MTVRWVYYNPRRFIYKYDILILIDNLNWPFSGCNTAFFSICIFQTHSQCLPCFDSLFDCHLYPICHNSVWQKFRPTHLTTRQMKAIFQQKIDKTAYGPVNILLFDLIR